MGFVADDLPMVELVASVVTEAVFVIDRHYRITYASPSASELLGWSVDELVGRTTPSLLHPEDLGVAAAEAEALHAEHGNRYRATVRLAHRDGGYRWVEVAGTNLFDDPRVGGAVTTARDVTAEVEARLAAERFRDIIAVTPDVVAVVDGDERLVELNRAGRRLLGRSDDEPLDGVPLRSLFPDWSWRILQEEGLPTARDEGHWSAELALRDHRGSERPVSHQVVAQRDAGGDVRYLASISRDISEQKALEARLQHEATHDRLTGLSNRATFEVQLAALLAHPTRAAAGLALLFFDVDGFKQVNDRHGHGVGDAVLRSLGDRLRTSVRSHDLVARYAGDEFVVACPGVEGPHGARALAELIHRRLCRPVHVAAPAGDGEGALVLPLEVSMGVALALPGDRVGELVVRADEAMYAAKAAGRNCVVVAPTG